MYSFKAGLLLTLFLATFGHASDLDHMSKRRRVNSDNAICRPITSTVGAAVSARSSAVLSASATAQQTSSSVEHSTVVTAASSHTTSAVATLVASTSVTSVSSSAVVGTTSTSGVAVITSSASVNSEVATTVASASTSTTTGTTSSGVSELEGSRSGIATFYGGNWDGGACLFTDYPQGSWNGTAISSTQWFGSAACGACLEVTGSSGTVTVMVVDECPECDENHLDLFEDIATTVDANAATDGEFDITWELVPCAVTGNMQFKNKSGASAYWFAMQVRNTVVPVDSLEVSIDGGSTWTSVEREDYNFFVYSSGFGSSVDIRVTSMTGEQITQSDVEVSDGLIVEGSSQFSY